MQMANLHILAAIGAVILLVYRYVIYPALLSPLSKIPNAHLTASISPLWILWKRLRFQENRAIYAAHNKLGPVVRLGPNEVSVNCFEDGLRSIYTGGYERHAWYHIFANYDGVPTMFSTAERAPHAHRKRMLSNAYAKSTVQSSLGFAKSCNHIIYQRLLPEVQSLLSREEAAGTIDLFKFLNYTMMDLVTSYVFGLRSSSNFLQNQASADHWLDLYQSRKSHVFWPQEFPILTRLLSKIGIHLSPKWVAQHNIQIEDWCLDMCDRAEAQMGASNAAERAQDVPIIFQQLHRAMHAEVTSKASLMPAETQAIRLAIASEMLDQVSAGHETSAITLSYLFHELCLDASLQASLRAELLTACPELSAPLEAGVQYALPSPKSIDALPFLHAVLLETLRRHAAIPGPQPRTTPSTPGGVALGGYTNIPAGVRVSSSAYSLHRNPTVFPSPLNFQPTRWLPTSNTSDVDDKAEQHRYLWAFSSGGRMCIGSNLAMQQMKLVVAVLVARYEFGEVVDEGPCGGMEQEDTYTAQPRGKRLVVRLREARDGG